MQHRESLQTEISACESCVLVGPGGMLVGPGGMLVGPGGMLVGPGGMLVGPGGMHLRTFFYFKHSEIIIDMFYL